MTPAEFEDTWFVGPSWDRPRFSEALAALLAEREQAVREECAKIAATSPRFVVAFDPRDTCSCPEDIAAAIRAAKEQA